MGDKNDDRSDKSDNREADPAPRRLIDIADERKLLASLAALPLASVLGPKLHGNYCGPGGGGTPVDKIDDACSDHDQCLADVGVNGVTLFLDKAMFSALSEERRDENPRLILTPEQREAANACDRKFCEDVDKVDPSALSLYEKGVGKGIDVLFKCPVPGADRDGPER